jgi:hypothetical protein
MPLTAPTGCFHTVPGFEAEVQPWSCLHKFAVPVYWHKMAAATTPLSGDKKPGELLHAAAVIMSLFLPRTC